MLKRIRTAMGRRDGAYRLSGVIEFDDAYFGGATTGKRRGRGTEKAKVFVALSLDERGKPLYLKMRVTKNIKCYSGAVDKVIPTHKKNGTIAAGQLSYYTGKADAPAPRPTGNYPVARSWYNRENGKG